MATKAISLFNVLSMLVLITFWGSSFAFVKVALSEGLTPVAVATFRFLFAGGLFSIVLVFKRAVNPNYVVFVEKKDLLTLLSLALFGVTFFFTVQYTGIQMAGASAAAIFVCFLSPIFITVLSTRIFREHLSKKQIFGVGIAALGTLTVVSGGTLNFQGDAEFFWGSLILLFTPVLWTVYSLLGKKTIEKYDPFLVVAYVTVLGAVCLVPLSLAENSLQQIFSLTASNLLTVLYLSITCSFLGYYIWFYVLKQVGAAVASTFLFGEPLVTVMFAAVLVGEEITVSTLSGGLLIFAGVYLVTRK